MKLEVSIGLDLEGFALDLQFGTEADRLVLYGPSGSGKSLTLSILAGITRADRGSILFEGETFFDSRRDLHKPARERRVGWVPQSYALFPHMDVRENLLFAVEAADAEQAERRLDHWLDRFDLEDLQHRFPDELSGGQQQRLSTGEGASGRPVNSEVASLVESGNVLTLEGVREHGVEGIRLDGEILECALPPLESAPRGESAPQDTEELHGRGHPHSGAAIPSLPGLGTTREGRDQTPGGSGSYLVVARIGTDRRKRDPIGHSP